MIGSLRQVLGIAIFFCVACEPSATQTGTTVPIGTSSGQATSDAPSVKPKTTGEPSANTGSKTIFVRDHRVDCEGEGPMSCMQVRETGSEEWSLFYGKIEGFSYEDGYAYELRVQVEEVKAPPADRPSRRLKLVEIVSKEKAAKSAP